MARRPHGDALAPSNGTQGESCLRHDSEPGRRTFLQQLQDSHLRHGEAAAAAQHIDVLQQDLEQ